MKYLKPMNLYREVLKLKAPAPLLGLDVNPGYVDISISDASKKVCAPLMKMDRTGKNSKFVASKFQTLISKLSVSGLVIVHPSQGKKFACDMEWRVQVDCFIDGLTKTGKFQDINYTFWEETNRVQVIESLLKPWKKHLHQQDDIYEEEFAATNILQGYMDFVNKNKEDQAFSGEKKTLISYSGMFENQRGRIN